MLAADSFLASIFFFVEEKNALFSSVERMANWERLCGEVRRGVFDHYQKNFESKALANLLMLASCDTVCLIISKKEDD
jgi:hypothetical protein